MQISRLKVATFSTVLLAMVAWACWFVMSAYLTEPSATNVKLSGVELVVETQKDLGPSPLSLNKLSPLVSSESASNILAFVDETPVTEDLGSAQILGGKASISGTVFAGTNPLAGAKVRIERETNSGIAATELTANSDGEYEIKNIKGGRYRVRAYMPFEFTSAKVETVFIEEFESAEKSLPWKTKTESSRELSLNTNLDLTVKSHKSSFRFEVSAPDVAYAGATSELAVAITSSEIDEEGVVVIKPVSGIKVDLGNVKGYKWVNNQTKNTDANGLTNFSFTCVTGSNGSLTATADGNAVRTEQIEPKAVKVVTSGDESDSAETDPIAPTFKRVTEPVSLRSTITMPPCQEYIPPVVEEPAEATESDSDE